MRRYDLCVIGSGPAGQKAAIQASKLGKRVCVIEQCQVVGGAAVNTGTIPSKALREAILRLGNRPSGFAAPDDLMLAKERTLTDLRRSCQRVIGEEIEMINGHLSSNGIDLVYGRGELVSPTRVDVVRDHGRDQIEAGFIVIAVGSSPSRPKLVPFDLQNVITSDEMLHLDKLPKSMIIVGGGVIGTEYASMLSALGVKITLVEGRPRLLDFVDSEITEALQYHLRQGGMTLRLGEKVVKIEKSDAPAGAKSSDGVMVEAMLESGKSLRADTLLYCIGRQGSTDGLNLRAAGLSGDERGRIKVNANFQTDVPNIYAVGDVIGFPALASTSMEQGRVAACHMFGEHCDRIDNLLPYGIYAIPEISMVGWTEDRLTAESIPYESGVAQYKEIARGQLIGDEIGMLKLLIHQDSRAILGVHVLGTGATELIHIGQAVIAFKGTVEYFVNCVFNYPTLAECYKVAALNALNKLQNR